MKILIDNGHGENTPGKRSPDGKLMEYAYAREIADRVVFKLIKLGYDAERIVREVLDVPLSTRCKRVNEICKQQGGASRVILVSIHCNASGGNGKWHSARGWSVHVSLNASSKSKKLADVMFEAAKNEAAGCSAYSGVKMRPYNGTKQVYWQQDLAICRATNCPAILTENLFMDNEEDMKFLLSAAGKNYITDLHVQGIINYINTLK